MILALAAIIHLSNNLGYVLPAIIGLESMGIPSPGETALVLAAVLASQGKLDIVLVLVIGIASAIVGDNIGYLIGRHLGREVLEAPGPFRKRRVMVIRAGDRFFQRHGGKSVFLARWVALVRVAAAWLAGINHMPFKKFFAWNALGGITWGITFGLVGYFGGQAAANVLAEAGLIGAIFFALLLIGAYLMVRRRERQMEHLYEEDAQRSDEEPDRAAAASPDSDPEPAASPDSDPEAATSPDSDPEAATSPDSEPEAATSPDGPDPGRRS